MTWSPETPPANVTRSMRSGSTCRSVAPAQPVADGRAQSPDPPLGWKPDGSVRRLTRHPQPPSYLTESPYLQANPVSDPRPPNLAATFHAGDHRFESGWGYSRSARESGTSVQGAVWRPDCSPRAWTRQSSPEADTSAGSVVHNGPDFRGLGAERQPGSVTRGSGPCSGGSSSLTHHGLKVERVLSWSIRGVWRD